MKKVFFVFIIFLLAIFTAQAHAQLRTDSNTVRTQIGNPPVQSSGGWPTSGYLMQGPLGPVSHASIKSSTNADSLDIADPSSPPIYSAFDGTITAVNDCYADGCRRGWGGYGNSVVVTSDNGSFNILYGHLASFSVTQGQSVRAGEILGYMGTTGVSTGIHLHWEFRNIPMEPPYIPQPISPLNCNSSSTCTPSYITPDAASI